MKARSLSKETILDIGRSEKTFPKFKVGDTIEVEQTIKEGDKDRTQSFLGDVIGLHHNGVASTFTLRRIGANGVGIEKIFPFHSPTLSNIRLVKVGKVRRAKLYYIRERLGKAARIKEKVLTKEQKGSATAAGNE